MTLARLAAVALLTVFTAIPVHAEPFIRGIVEEITTDPQRLTIAHEPIPNLEMEAMTMVFRVADPEMLDGLAVGQEIEFEAARINGRLTVTALRDPS